MDLPNLEDNSGGTVSRECSLKCFSPKWSVGKYSFLRLISYGEPEVYMCMDLAWFISELSPPHCIMGCREQHFPYHLSLGPPTQGIQSSCQRVVGP